MKLGWIVCFAIVITQMLSAQSEPEKKTTEDSHLLGYSPKVRGSRRIGKKSFVTVPSALTISAKTCAAERASASCWLTLR